MRRQVATNPDAQEEYLQISQNIFKSMSLNRPPVTFYYFNEELHAIKELHPANRRVPSHKTKEIEDLGTSGNLFLSRREYSSFAEHLSRNLGLLLTEHVLDAWDVADLFRQALILHMREFLHQPLDSTLSQLRNDITILSEYVWIDPARVLPFPLMLFQPYDIAHHSVNSCLLGVSIMVMLKEQALDHLAMTNSSLGFLLHDIGMTGVPKSIILKEGPLLNRDRSSVEQHTTIGMNILNRLKVNEIEIIHCLMEHHERMNGGGYPRNLKGDQISEVGRVCAVADSFSAMVMERPYSKPMDIRAATVKLRSDPRYDPAVIKALIKLVALSVKKYVEERKESGDEPVT